MNKEELFEVLEEMDDQAIQDAKEYRAKKKMPAWQKWSALAACACLVILAATIIPRLNRETTQETEETAAVEMEESQDLPAEGVEDAAENPTSTETYGGLALASAVYPAPVAQTMDAQEFMESDEHWEWWDTYRTKIETTAAYQSDLAGYYQDIMEKILVSEEENTVCSPLNTYIAFAMLAEVSDGETRQQILDMLHVSDIGTLRKEVNALWESNYVDTPMLKSLLANSLWLRNNTAYNNDTLQTLAKEYYATAFAGEMGSSEMSEALRRWTDENTGGLLTDYTKDMRLDPETVLAIVSTIYYKASWVDEFRPQNTTKETFHGTDGDQTVDMMHRSDMMGVYRTDTFTSVGLGLSDSGSMYFFLPEGTTDVNDLVTDPDLLKAVSLSDDAHWSSPEVNLSVPKFKVSGKTDLLEAIRALGVTDALDPGLADFTPLTEDADSIYLSKAEHAALVEVDEEGVTGAAYTELAMAEGAAEPDEILDIVIDRPFLFVITGRDGSILFSGIVRNIK